MQRVNKIICIELFPELEAVSIGDSIVPQFKNKLWASDRTRYDGESQSRSDRVTRQTVSLHKFLPIGNSKSLQGLRAIAAGFVVLYHANHSFFGTAKYWPDHPFGSFFEMGHAGVEFFFVLSGFIIYAAHQRDIGNQAKFGSFVWKRFRRVYPVYWVMLLLVTPLYFLVPSLGIGMERQPGVIADSFVLVHIFGGGQVLTVSWTLFHEIAFYAIFALVILNRRVGGFVLGAWIAGSAVALVDPTLIPPVLAFILSPLHVLFGMGMAVAWLINRRRIAAPWAAAVIGTAIFFGTGVEEVWGGHLSADTLTMLYGLGSTLVVAGSVELERSGKLKVPQTFVFLGNASYSVYLVHIVAMSVLAKVAMAVMARVAVPHALTYIALVISSAAIGVVYHMFVEVPLLAFLGQLKLAPQLTKNAPAEATSC